MYVRLCILGLIGFLLSGCTPSQTREPHLRLWFNQPAEVWTEALPVGNGKLGAMVYGGVKTEHIQFKNDQFYDE